MKASIFYSIKLIILNYLLLFIFLNGQTHFQADPHYLLQNEKLQFEAKRQMNSNIFRPFFYQSDSTTLSIEIRSEVYLNDDAPNQENMDVRYISKGLASFNSFQIGINSKYFSFLAEPYMISNVFYPIETIKRIGPFSVLNDQNIEDNTPNNKNLRNLLLFINYKGIGFGWHQGNRWWGPGIHTSLQMTNNSYSFPAQIMGTMKEIRLKSFGIYALYTFAKLNDLSGSDARYFTSLNGQISWYGPAIFTIGFNRSYLTGGAQFGAFNWTESDARKIIFEDIFISNLVKKEYTIGGHDVWDQTLSGYISITLPKRDLKLYGEFGLNDNRMYFADLLSQPDHSMASIIGVRDYGIGTGKNWLWGFEWTNLMITYSSRHRITGPGTWYINPVHDYSSYYGRRWAAHSGTDSDDWYLYFGYLSDKFMIVPSFNYERHGIVSQRPAEVKVEFRLDSRYQYNNIWFGIYYEKQFEAFLGFPKYFYVDNQNKPTGYHSRSHLANSRTTNTVKLSIYKNINF